MFQGRQLIQALIDGEHVPDGCVKVVIEATLREPVMITYVCAADDRVQEAIMEVVGGDDGGSTGS